MYLRIIQKPQDPCKFIKQKTNKVYEFYLSGQEHAVLAKEFIDMPGGFRKVKLINGNKTLIAERFIISVTKKQLVKVISETPQSKAYNAQPCRITEYYLIDNNDIFVLQDFNSSESFLKPFKVEKTIKVNPDNTESDGSPKNPKKLIK